MAVNEPRSDEEWIDVYADQRGLYDAFADRLEDLLETLLDEEEIAYAWALSFSVAPDSARVRRSTRRAATVTRSTTRSTADCGSRGVRIGIETQVDACGDRGARRGGSSSVDSAGSLSIDEAAARNDRLDRRSASTRWRTSIRTTWSTLDERSLDLPEWSRFAGLKVRIELKTLLQDAWEASIEELPFVVGVVIPSRSPRPAGAIGPGLVWRSTPISPRPRRRSRASWREYDDAVAAGDLQLPVNGVSLLAYIRTSGARPVSLTESRTAVGSRYDPDYDSVG